MNQDNSILRTPPRTKTEIEQALHERGFRMEASLAVFDGSGHALVDVNSDELVDAPDADVAALATAWTILEGPAVGVETHDIDMALLSMGYRMKGSESALDAGGVLVDIATGNEVAPPTIDVLKLESAWNIAEFGESMTPPEGHVASLAGRWRAAPGQGECTGPVVALSDNEVIQSAGRGSHIAWTRQQIPDAHIALGETITIRDTGEVQRAAPGNALGR
jgi:hypothetical protein